MTRVPPIRRISKENFAEEYAGLVEGIANSVNQFQEDVIDVLDHGIDYDNLNRQFVIADVRIDATGQVINRPSIKITLTSKIRGISCIKAENLDNPSIYPTQAPFVSFTLRTGVVDVLNVSGLQNNSQYRLTLELIG